MVVKLANNASSTLAGAINSSVTSLSVASGDASKFPSLGAGEWFPLTVVDSAGNMEIMKVTARSGATLTVTRGQEGTTAKSFAAGAKCDIRLTAAAQVDHEHAISAIVGLVAALAAKADDSEIADLYLALGLKADASAVTSALSTKASLLSDGLPDNTFSASSAIPYVDGTTQKLGTFEGLIESIFDGARTITNGRFFMSSFRLWNADQTFRYQFVGSPTANRNINLPDGPVTMPAGTLATTTTMKVFAPANTAVVNGGKTVLAHGLGDFPDMWQAYLVCVVANNGFAVGQRVDISGSGSQGAAARAYNSYADATNITLQIASSGINALINGSGAGTTLTASDWAIGVRAYKWN